MFYKALTCFLMHIGVAVLIHPHTYTHKMATANKVMFSACIKYTTPSDNEWGEELYFKKLINAQRFIMRKLMKHKNESRKWNGMDWMDETTSHFLQKDTDDESGSISFTKNATFEQCELLMKHFGVDQSDKESFEGVIRTLKLMDDAEDAIFKITYAKQAKVIYKDDDAEHEEEEEEEEDEDEGDKKQDGDYDEEIEEEDDAEKEEQEDEEEESESDKDSIKEDSVIG